MNIIKNYTFVLIVLSLFGFNSLNAQTILKGKVKDENGQPLHGVNIFIHQSHTGTITDAEGNYLMPLSTNLKLLTVEYSYIGYRSTLRSIDLTEVPLDMEFVLDVQLVESHLELEEITITARFAQEKDDIPYPISTMTKNQISSSGYTNISQAMAKTPGVYFSSFGNGVSKPVIRGLTNNNVVLLNNGIKQQNFNFSSNHPFLIDEFAANRIEIIKGPASLQYGSDAVGGVINIVRERPTFPNTLSGDFNSQYNTNTSGFMNNLGIKASGNTFFGGFRAGFKSHEDFTDGNGTKVFNTRFNEYNISTNAGIRSNRGIFSLNYNYTSPKYGVQNQASENLFKVYSELLNSGRENQVWYQDLEDHLISSNNTLFYDKNTLDVDLAYQMNTRELLTGGYNDQQQQLEIPTVVSMQLNTFTYNVKWSMPINQHQILIGANGANVNNESDETKPNNPVLDSKISDIGLYSIGNFPLNDDINLAAGIRYDYRNMQSFPTPTATTDRFEIDNSYNNFTGSIGASYNFEKEQYVKANLSTGYRSPSMPELTQNGIHAGRYEQGDPSLNAQRNYQMDVNYHFHNSWLTLDLSPFYNIINNYIYLVQTDSDAPIGTGKIFQHSQNDANLYGGEIAMDLHPYEWMGIHSAYSLTRAEIIDHPEGYEYPTFIPQDRLSGEIKLEQKQIGILKNPFLAVEVLHFLEQNRIGQNETDSPDYTLLNARIGTSISVGQQTFDIFINGNNILDATYIDHLSVTKPLGLNMIGRNIVFGLKIPFSYNIE